MKLRISLLALSTLLIAAHFLRTSSFVPMLVCIAAPCIMFIKKRWSVIVVQVFLVASAFIWLMTLYGIIQLRIMEGRSWTASAVILGVVTAFTLLTGWLLNSPVVKERYP